MKIISEKRREQLREIASQIREMDPADVYLESANWMGERGCRTIAEICFVRSEVYDRKGWIA